MSIFVYVIYALDHFSVFMGVLILQNVYWRLRFGRSNESIGRVDDNAIFYT